MQPEAHFVLLQLCSFGLYNLFWMYVNWDLIRTRNRWNITPAARALFPVFWFRSYCAEILKLGAAAGHPASPEAAWPIAAAWVVLTLGSGATAASDTLWAFLAGVVCFAGSVGVLLPVLRALNAFWRQEQPGLPVRTRLSNGALCVVLLGGFIWLIAFAGMLFFPG